MATVARRKMMSTIVPVRDLVCSALQIRGDEMHIKRVVFVNGICILTLVLSMLRCSNPGTSDIEDPPTVTDADGNVYSTVRIGNQLWTTENYRCTKFADGTQIPHVTDGLEWRNLTSPAYCFYHNTTIEADKEKYGALYNWSAVNSSKFAPPGWHVPSYYEWVELEENLVSNGYNYDNTTSGNKIGKSLAAKTDWSKSDDVGDVGNDLTSNNSSGFSALPGGWRGDLGSFSGQGGYNGLWWSATERDSSFAFRRGLGYDNNYLASTYSLKLKGYSVRLIKD